ncbi:HAD-IIIC family phosphatase [Brevibacillus agri]|uniref:HAD-IIIC family phosphatase n=1 Tax=Brevibacillus agri TaxID=51101 RepID=UPI001EE5CC84|nr:HAD-IIIC family phosphatase [Brevibacillus agri]MCG5250370.1 HAD-IIIC family phosphatase [Brevibacillus agri]MED4568775.1 HAD-IIIC family phosphatase [Brevibacillus agri]
MELKNGIKCVVWDLDNTVWKGVLSEGDEVALYPQVKEIMEQLDQRGILQSVASKNNYDDAMRKLKEFGIDHYFLYPQIHWEPKSKSVGAIQQAINIGMDTLLFIDDQPFELDEVKSVHDSVNCLHAGRYTELLTHPSLIPAFITEDSKKRRLMYLQDMERQQEEESFTGTSEEFLKTLDMKFIISEAQEDCLKRAEELTVRTNQLNSTGRIYSYDELNYFRHSPDHKLYVCELTDKYGSYGKIGIALVEMNETHWHIKLLIMSCRVISRGVGTVLLTHIMQQARQEGKRLLADFKNTERNKMMYVSYRFSNFKEVSKEEDGFVILENDLTQIQKFPPYIEVLVL